MLKKILCSTLVTVIMVQSAVAESYSARYKAHYKGVEGEAEYVVNKGSNGHYSAELSIVPDNFLLKMTVGSLVDKVSGQFRNGHFYPENYHRKADDEIALSVDFLDDNAYISDDKGNRQFPISQLGQDPLSQIAQIQFDIQNHQLQSSYYLVTNKKQRRYEAQQVGNKVILNEYPSRKRQLILWFDSSASTLLKMQKNKGPRRDFVMEKLK